MALSCPTKCCCFQIKCLEFSVCNFEIREGYLWVTDWRNVQLWTFLVLNAVIVHWSLCGFRSFFNFESASYDKNPQIVGQFNFGSRAFLSAFWLNGNKSYQKSYGVPLKVCGPSSKKVRACLPPLVCSKSSIRQYLRLYSLPQYKNPMPICRLHHDALLYVECLFCLMEGIFCQPHHFFDAKVVVHLSHMLDR